MTYSVIDTSEARERIEKAIERTLDAFGELGLTVGESLVACEALIEALRKEILPDKS